jgi:pre-mRNA-splicing factor RBM22/SLT11
MLKQLARTDPYYKRNRPQVCSFFAKGECNRGNDCPFRHEMPQNNELSHQTIQARYHGHNDPVARKILAANAENHGLRPPDDTTIVRMILVFLFEPSLITLQTSLFLSSLSPKSTEQSIRTRVIQSLPSVDPTQLKSIVHVAKTRLVPPILLGYHFLTHIQMRVYQFPGAVYRRNGRSGMGEWAGNRWRECDY